MKIKEELIEGNYSLVCSNGYKSKETGIKPIINKLNENIYFFEGQEVVDKIVGKAAAMLFTLSRVKKVHALVLSITGKQIFEKYNIEYSYDNLTEVIINRKGDDMCPMEKTVKDIDDLQIAYKKLKEKVM